MNLLNDDISLYLEFLNTAIRSDSTLVINSTFLKRGIGKSLAIATLATAYRLPVFVGNNINKRHLEEEINKLSHIFNNENPPVYVINDSFRGKRFNTILIDDSITSNALKDFLSPITKTIIGFMG